MPTSLPVLVAGAINTDLVATMSSAPGPGETITATTFAIHAGGKGANQAVAAARSGTKVTMVGAIGEDDFGTARLRDLEREGIETTWVRRSSTAASGVALILVEDHGENRIAYVPGATTTIGSDHCVRALQAVRPGIVLATNELPQKSLGALFAEARRLGATVILNATPDPERAVELLGLVDIVIVNAGEAARILAAGDDAGDDLEPHGAIEAVRAFGPGTVIITLGADGVVGNERDTAFAHPAPAVPVVDTTGAGDTFCGAFAASLGSESSISEAARYGVLASALSVTRAGAQAGIPTRQQVTMFAEGL
ncbi:MAG: Ribokinase [uncultured Thermomicrobiales bacterium]|uniref:Ribokinase n=1 Tax=uncultured Thermomicrobiales bacterium TaxID=1645740 RepID=A0A6J4UH24_9BACT|nr:MAG: Ribokinase [uncultured Thermomicrobiales bacterium]